MKFYDSIGPNPRVVRMAMAEKGMSLPTETIDIMAGANRSGDYIRRCQLAAPRRWSWMMAAPSAKSP